MDKQELKQRLDAYLAENLLEEEDFAEESRVCYGAPKLEEEDFAEEPRVCYEASKPAMRFLLRRTDLEDIFAKNKGETFSEMMTRLVEESGEKNSAVYYRAQIDRQLFSRIRNNKEYQPSKDTAVALAIALKLDMAKAKEFLASAGYTLSKSKRDLIIAFFIENKIFDTNQLNECLYDYNQPILHNR